MKLFKPNTYEELQVVLANYARRGSRIMLFPLPYPIKNPTQRDGEPYEVYWREYEYWGMDDDGFLTGTYHFDARDELMDFSEFISLISDDEVDLVALKSYLFDEMILRMSKMGIKVVRKDSGVGNRAVGPVFPAPANRFTVFPERCLEEAFHNIELEIVDLIRKNYSNPVGTRALVPEGQVSYFMENNPDFDFNNITICDESMNEETVLRYNPISVNVYTTYVIDDGGSIQGVFSISL